MLGVGFLIKAARIPLTCPRKSPDARLPRDPWPPRAPRDTRVGPDVAEGCMGTRADPRGIGLGVAAVMDAWLRGVVELEM